jgi:hypothetical protein
MLEVLMIAGALVLAGFLIDLAIMRLPRLWRRNRPAPPGPGESGNDP